MTEEELREIELALEQDRCDPEDMRRLIHAVRSLNKQTDTIQRALGDLINEKH